MGVKIETSPQGGPLLIANGIKAIFNGPKWCYFIPISGVISSYLKLALGPILHLSFSEVYSPAAAERDAPCAEVDFVRFGRRLQRLGVSGCLAITGKTYGGYSRCNWDINPINPSNHPKCTRVEQKKIYLQRLGGGPLL